MSVTDFLDINIQEQEDDTQVFNLVKRVASSFKFGNTIWMPNYEVPAALLPIPQQPGVIQLLYIRNIGSLNVGVAVLPNAVISAPPIPPPVVTDITLLGPGGICLLYSPDLANAGMVPNLGPFLGNISGGFLQVYLQASSPDPSALGLVECFMGI
jgi:hypothetical protein